MPASEPQLPDRLARSVLEFLPDGLLVVDETGHIVSANQRMCDLFGYTMDELVGESVELLIPEEARGRHTAHRTRFGAEPAVRTMGVGRTLSGRRRDGSELAVEVGLSPMKNDAGMQVVAIVRDVTEQVALREHSELIQQVIDATHDGVYMFHPETLRFTYVNDGAMEQTGYSETELLAMTPLHIKPSFSEPEFRALIEPLIAEATKSVEFETVHRRKDGTDVAVEIILEYPAVAQTDLSRPLVAVARDITDRKVVEERLRTSEEAFRRTFADAPVAMAVVALDGEGSRSIRETNGAFEELFGHPSGGSVGLAFTDFIHPDDAGEVAAVAQALARGGQSVYRTEKRFRRADGTYVWAQLHSATMGAWSGEPTVLAHLIDISDRKAAEAARERYESQTVLISRLRLALLSEQSLAQSLQQLCDDVRSSALASDAMILERDDAAEGLVGWGSALAASGSGTNLSPAMEAVTLLDDFDAVPVVLRSDDPELAPEDRKALDLLDAHTVVAGAIGGRRALAVVCANTDQGANHEVESLARLVVDVGEAIALAQARSNQQRMGLLEDRERIATDLHDVVIQRLFAAGMRLQAALPLMDEAVRARLHPVVGELDTTIAEIRDTIFALHQQGAVETSLTSRITDTVRSNKSYLGFEPKLNLDRALDAVAGPVAEHLVPVITEMLSNVARHAGASSVDLEVTIESDRLALTVTDDGRGVDPDAPRGRGLDNLARRASDHGGEFSIEPASPTGGTKAVWSVPLD